MLDIPVWLDTIICQLLEKDPEKRPFSAALVSEALGRVREKVEAQQSAGVDAAKKRRIDRASVDTRLDETDKETARILLGKKKKKSKVVPFYRKGWFTVAAIAGLMTIVGSLFYVVVLKVPSPETYLERARTLLKATDFKERKEGRETIDEFMLHYPDDPLAGVMRNLADQYDLVETEKQLHNRRQAKFRPDGDGEDLARQALDDEDLGKLAEARRLWQQLAKFEVKKGDDHAWGLVAKKYLAELQAVADLGKTLEVARVSNKKNAGESAEERLALEAVRQEQPSQALSAWNDLKTRTRDNPDKRLWYLLAAQKYREWNVKQQD